MFNALTTLLSTFALVSAFTPSTLKNSGVSSKSNVALKMAFETEIGAQVKFNSLQTTSLLPVLPLNNHIFQIL